MDKNQSANPHPLAWGTIDGPKSQDKGSWASQAARKRIGLEIQIDPVEIPAVEIEAVTRLCRFLIYGQGYTAEQATKIVDYYLNFLEAHPEIKEEYLG